MKVKNSNSLNTGINESKEINIDMEEPIEFAAKIDIAKSEIKIYVDLYKDHFNLWLKGYAVYLAILGALGTIFFKTGTTTTVKYALCFISIIVSITSGLACTIALKWLVRVRSRIEEVSKILGIEPFPVFGAIGVGLVATVACIIFCFAGIICIIGVWKGMI